MLRLVAFCRVIARRVVYGVVHTYSKRTTQIGWGNGGYPQFGGKPTFKPHVRFRADCVCLYEALAVKVVLVSVA